jgi:hypothetical protein
MYILNTDDRDQICICSSCKLLSEDLETGSLNREGTYTPISFEITNDEGYQYENNTQISQIRHLLSL